MEKNKKLSKKELDKINGDWIKLHEEMHVALENLIDSDRNLNKIHTTISSNYNITDAALRNHTHLSKAVASDLHNDISISQIKLSDEKRRALAEYFRSVIYCGSYCGLNKYDFARLFEILVDKFQSVTKKGEFLELAGLGTNDIKNISKQKKSLDTKEQREILNHFRSLCFDSMNNKIEEFEEVRDLLDILLGKDLCTGGKQFYDIYFKYCVDPEEEISELEKLSEIRADDLRKIFFEENHPYYPQKLHELSCIMLERSEEIIPTVKLKREDRWFLGLLKQTYLDTEYRWQIEEWEEDEALRHKNVTDWFMTLPDPLKELVYKYSLVLVEAHKCCIQIRYLEQSKEYVDRHFALKDFRSIIRILTKRFCLLSMEKKNEVLEYLRKYTTIPFPAPFYEKNEKIWDVRIKNDKKRFSECVAFSFSMSSLTASETLSEQYKDYPAIKSSPKRTLYMQERYRGMWSLRYVNVDYLKEMLDFTSAEWQFVGYMEAAVVANFPFDKIIELVSEAL